MAMPMTEQQRMWRLAGKYSAVGIEMAVSVGFGAFGGRWLDGKFGTTPWLFWFGIVVGFGAAFKAVQRTIRDYKRDSNASAKDLN